MKRALEKMAAKKFLNHGAIFDIMMFGLFFSLSPVIRHFLDKEFFDSTKTTNPKLGLVYLATVAAQTLGLLMKRKRIAAMRNESDDLNNPNGGAIFGLFFVIIMHGIIFGFFFLNNGLNLIFGEISSTFFIVLKIIVILIPTSIGIYITFYKKESVYLKDFTLLDNIIDILATLLLGISVLIATTFFCNMMILDVLESYQPHGIVGSLFMTILFFSLFLIFYLPPRWAFLLVDYNKKETWIRIFIVFLPFLRNLW